MTTGRSLRGVLTILAAFGVAGIAGTSAAATLDEVKQRGELVCGVSQGLLGFSAEQGGAWLGFDVDFCRAVAAAIFNDPQKVKFVPLSASERFDALTARKIDLLSRNSTWTLGREAGLGLAFAGITYYDGQGFLVPRTAGVTSALELKDAKVCVQAGTTSEANAVDFLTGNNITYTLVQTPSAAESLAAYTSGRCNVVTSDVSQLYAERLKLKDAADHVILPEVISKEPLGPAVRQDDPKWRLLVEWVHFAMLNAEELGIRAGNIAEAAASKKPDVMRFVGTDGKFGEQLGLSNDWALNIVRLVGSYGESYERNLGTDSRLGIPRGLNQLWSMGGIQYAPPIR
jgi:general L-amino acid transport system substrate-binding protein